MVAQGSLPGSSLTHGTASAKQRSVHNTYFTLPVLFAMLSNHYGWFYNHELNWLVLILMMFAGAAIRQFVMRHGSKLGRNTHPWPYATVGVLVLLGGWAGSPALQAAAAMLLWRYPAGRLWPAGDAKAAFRSATAARILCRQKNVKFDTPDEVKGHAQQIYQQVVQLRKMPFGNPGALSVEVGTPKRWYEGGAPVTP